MARECSGTHEPFPNRASNSAAGSGYPQSSKALSRCFDPLSRVFGVVALTALPSTALAPEVIALNFSPLNFALTSRTRTAGSFHLRAAATPNCFTVLLTSKAKVACRLGQWARWGRECFAGLEPRETLTTPTGGHSPASLRPHAVKGALRDLESLKAPFTAPPQAPRGSSRAGLRRQSRRSGPSRSEHTTKVKTPLPFPSMMFTTRRPEPIRCSASGAALPQIAHTRS